MTKVEMHPAVLFHCDFCSHESWHNCTLRTGIEALGHMIGNIRAAVELDEFVRAVQHQCEAHNMRCPPLPDFRTAVSIHVNFNCKNCGGTVGCMKRGLVFTCDDCGRDNHFLPQKKPDHVSCQYCHSQFEVEMIFQ
jgi:hypothetical protein